MRVLCTCIWLSLAAGLAGQADHGAVGLEPVHRLFVNLLSAGAKPPVAKPAVRKP